MAKLTLQRPLNLGSAPIALAMRSKGTISADCFVDKQPYYATKIRVQDTRIAQNDIHIIPGNAGPGVHHNSTRLGGTLCPEASTGPQRRECAVCIETHCGGSAIPSANCKSPPVANLHRPRQLEALLALRAPASRTISKS
jgi:hypothetical protein